MQILTLLFPFYIFLVIGTWLHYGVVSFGCHSMRMAEACARRDVVCNSIKVDTVKQLKLEFMEICF